MSKVLVFEHGVEKATITKMRYQESAATVLDGEEESTVYGKTLPMAYLDIAVLQSVFGGVPSNVTITVSAADDAEMLTDEDINNLRK